MTVAGDRAKRWLVVVVLAVACKPRAAKDANQLTDDLAQIEAELQRSDARLGDAGIVVAYRDTPTSAEVTTPQESPPEPDATKLEPTPTPPPTEPEATEEPGPVSPSTSPPTVEEPMPSAPTDTEDSPLLSGRREREHDKADRDSRRRVKKSARTRCERVCELSETTCELQDRVCTLADNHADDVRYEDACRRAEDQCEAATRSCESCAV